MAFHWFCFLLGATLLQGALLLNPINQDDLQDVSSKSDPSYRLVTTTKPRHYEVSLAPYFEAVPTGSAPFTFDGTVVIYISATEANVNQIVMHCADMSVSSVLVQYTDSDNVVRDIQSSTQDLACEEQFNFLRIATTQALQLEQEYVVTLSFTGNIQTEMRGFYRSWYIDSSNTKRWMGTTQFQPGYARYAFPCYDEPVFKATFDITINREADFSPSLSNMPIREDGTTILPNGRVAETFYTTPETSTYLLAFIVSHYVAIETGENEERPFEIYARDNAHPTGAWGLEVGELLLSTMEDFTNISYYGMAPNIRLQQAAIPDFNSGAMENWGLLTYREALILYDPLNSNHFYKQRVANIISHEITHLWFGNLVTCAWWDNLWLNEGFARYYQYFLTANVTDLGYQTRFIVEQLHLAMSTDSVDSAHALTNPETNSPDEVWDQFSSITYAKGACILKMTEHLLGSETHTKGLRSYLSTRAFDVAEPHHLFEALDAAAVEDGALSSYGEMTIDRYFRSWSEKAGHPMLSVDVNHVNGTMTVTQSRWHRDTGVSEISSIWDIPITWTRANDADFEDLKPSQFITTETTTIERGTEGLEWVIFNKQSSGFYRVKYDETTWILITRALRNDFTVIHEYNRAQIVEDLFALGRANVYRYETVLNILSFLEFENQYAPWIAAISGFNYLLRRTAHDEVELKKLQEYIITLSRSVTARLGFVERDNEPYMDGLLRMYVMEFLCDIGHEQCVTTARVYFENWKNGESIPANMRPWVYCVGLRQGTAEDFDYFWSRYIANDLASEEIVMLQKAGCTTDEESLERFLDAIVSDEDLIRPQDFSTALNSAIARNEVNTMRAFNWLKRNVEITQTALGSLSSPLSTIAQRLLHDNDVTEFEEWLQENSDLIGTTSLNAAANGVAVAYNNLVWSAERLPEIAQYVEIGYSDLEIVEATEPTTTEPPTSEAEATSTSTTTEIPSTTPEDGAATTSLSIIALIATLAINFLN